jgi:S1-C subfamily serine protease
LTNANPGEEFGPWGHKVADTSVEGIPIGFAGFFHRLGGIASFGFPKTDARQDDHPQAVLHTPGRPIDSRIRQYFQSAVLEYHPESPESPVKLSLLGDTLRDSRYPRRTWQLYQAFHREAPFAVGDHLGLGLTRRGPEGSSVEAVAAFLEMSLLRVQTEHACGSGFFVTDDGYALTTWTLASDAQSITVESPRGYTAPARLVAGDVAFDLALIKIDGDWHFPVIWDDTGSASVGDDLVTHGYRSTSILDGRATSCLAGPTAELRSYTHVASHQRSDFRPPIDVGNSGGPAALRSGQVAGLIAGGTPKRPSAEAFVPAAEIQPRISAWIADLDRGLSPARPPQLSYERTVLAQLDSVTCPSESTERGVWESPLAFRVQGREIELTATVELNEDTFSSALIEFGDAFHSSPYRHDLIILGEYYDYVSQPTLRWQRGDLYNPEIVRDERHRSLERGSTFDVKFVYNGGAVALFINGNAAFQDIDFPYQDNISIGIGCVDPYYYSDSPEITLTNVLVTGRPFRSI